MLTVQLQLLEAALHPLPVGYLVLLGKRGRLQVFSGVALEYAGADQKRRVGHAMHQGFGIVDDQLVALDALPQPGHEVFA